MTHYKTMTKLMISQKKKKQQQYCVDLLECTTTKSQNTPEGNQPQDTFRLKLILVSLFAYQSIAYLSTNHSQTSCMDHYRVFFVVYSLESILWLLFAIVLCKIAAETFLNILFVFHRRK